MLTVANRASRKNRLPTERYSQRLKLWTMLASAVFGLVVAAPCSGEPALIGVRRAATLAAKPAAPPRRPAPTPPAIRGATTSKPASPSGALAPLAPQIHDATPTGVVAPRTPFAELPPLDTSVPPPMLPAAPRERMRLCAEEWEKRKMTTRTQLQTWRDFAAACLTR